MTGQEARFTFNGGIIRNRIQRDKCHECGMGLCDPREYHPHAACEAYLRTHDSREVWRELRHRVKQRDTSLPGIEKLVKAGWAGWAA